MHSNDINAIFAKPLTKIVFPLAEEKSYPYYSQCSTKKKIRDVGKYSKLEAKISLKHTEKVKVQTTKKPNAKLKNVPEGATKTIHEHMKNDNSIKFPDHANNELVLPDRTVSRQHKWPAKHLKRPFDKYSDDIPHVPIKASRPSQFDLLGTLMTPSVTNSQNQKKTFEDVNKVSVKRNIVNQTNSSHNADLSSSLEHLEPNEVSSVDVLPEKIIPSIVSSRLDNTADSSTTIVEYEINKVCKKVVPDRKGEDKSNLERKLNVESGNKSELWKAVDSALELSEKFSKRKAATVSNNGKSDDTAIDEKDNDSKGFINKEKNLANQDKINANVEQTNKKEAENAELSCRGMVTRNMAKRRSGLTLKEQEIESKKRSEARKSSRQRIQEQKEQKELERQRLKAMPCQYFIRHGTCNYGDECRYSHDVEVERKKDCCRFYIAGFCLKGDACLFMHGEWPCKFFHQGYCSSGDKCKFSHDPLTDEMRSLLEARTELEEIMMKNNTNVENTKAVDDAQQHDIEGTQESKESSTTTTVSNPVDLLPSLYSELT